MKRGGGIEMAVFAWMRGIEHESFPGWYGVRTRIDLGVSTETN